MIERIHGKKKRYIKIYFAVDVKIKEVLSIDVTTPKLSPYLVHEASKRRVLAKLTWMLHTNLSKAYRLLKRMKIEAFIKLRKNARIDRGPSGEGGTLIWSRCMAGSYGVE